jgi:hypothetical protein
MLVAQVALILLFLLSVALSPHCMQVAIPLALRPGTEAFEEEKGRLEEMRRNRGGDEGEEE